MGLFSYDLYSAGTNFLYGPIFEQRMIWDPGIRVIKISTLHLADKVFFGARVMIPPCHWDIFSVIS